MSDITNYTASIIDLSKRSALASLTSSSGNSDYPYMMGYSITDVEYLLADLNLTKKQIKILQARTFANNRSLV